MIQWAYTTGMNILKYFYKVRFLHFLFVGGTGVLINLLLTWIFTEFVFGLEQYFYGYLIGLFANLVYNFTLHTILTYKTTKKHILRFQIFIVYSLVMSFVQAGVIKVITPIIGLRFYLIVIATVILVFSIINFLVFKLWLFKEDRDPKAFSKE